MPELHGIPAELLDAYWPRVAGQVEELAGISGGRLTAQDIVRALRAKDMQLWGATEGDKISVMLTEVRNYPQQRDAVIFGAHGQNADEWLPLWPLFEKWAIDQGCKVVIATHCRPGWKKLLAPLGFTETHLVLEKRL